MDNIVGNLIGGMVVIIIAYDVVLPTTNTAIYGNTGANLSTQNVTLSGIIQTLVILVIVIYFVRVMTG
jgi:small-conductance mechanosensitive channel